MHFTWAHNLIVVQKPFAVEVPCFCRDWSIPIQQDGVSGLRWVCTLCGAVHDAQFCTILNKSSP